MPSCIATIIKNEHLYLDEWITYHLNMGVSHIYIFEDIDSQSHLNITAKYPQVTLRPISFLFTIDELQNITHYKHTKQKNPHNVYLKRILHYLHTHYADLYDWCFVIDNDEFITLSDSNSLDNVLSNYAAYDAIILQWQCFGANGRITSPDYNQTTVVDTFITPVSGIIPVKTKASYSKTCYNLPKYKDEFFWYVHQPSDKCNFCNTLGQHDRYTPVYDKLYLRHYITRSWEEYVWKRTARGFLWGGPTRSLETFFVMNPDMWPLKSLLLSMLDKTLVVLPYSQRGSQGNELRLALKGWRKFCQFKYHFAVIGEFDPSLPTEFPWAQFIPVPNQPRQSNQYNPHLDIQHKFEIAYDLFHNRYPAFIYMVDDNYAIKPFTLFDILKPHYLQPSFTGVESLPTSYWKHDKWKTRQLLDSAGLPHVNYTTHFPCVFEFEKWHELWDRFDMRNEGYVPEGVYFNAFPPTEPAELASSIRLGLWKTSDLTALPAALASPSIKFLCNSVEGWSPALEAELNRLIA